MMQYDAVMALIPYLLPYSHDILIYTGDRYEDLPPLPHVAALIDGEYIEAENHCHPLIGSRNQRLLLLDEAYRVRYHRYLKSLQNAPSPIQNFNATDGHISVGIHRPQFLRVTPTIRKD